MIDALMLVLGTCGSVVCSYYPVFAAGLVIGVIIRIAMHRKSHRRKKEEEPVRQRDEVKLPTGLVSNYSKTGENQEDSGK